MYLCSISINKILILSYRLSILSDAIVEKTAYIYRKVEGRGLVRGRTIPGMLAAAVYLACREMGTPRTLKDIIRISNTKRKDIARNIRILTVELGINHLYLTL